MKYLSIIITCLLCVTSNDCTSAKANSLPTSTVTPTTLKDAFKEHFAVGATVGKEMLQDRNHPSLALAHKHFTTLTSDNSFKWLVINPKPQKYNFNTSDQFLKFGQKHNMQLIGHVLFWHSQTPDWVFEDKNGNFINRKELLKRMRLRAKTLAKRYGEHIKVWDVVNEAINDDGSLRNSKFHQIIGDDFIEQAFKIAEEEFPKDSIFLYNDYSMDRVGRRETVVNMVKDFKKRGIKIDAIGVQGHWSMTSPTLDAIDKSLTAFAATGLPIHITEMDIDYLGRDQYFGANVDVKKLPATPSNNPYPKGNFPPKADAELAQRYKELFSLLIKHSKSIDRVTFWGITDKDSWLNDWPIKGRTNYPLLFDRKGNKKPAFDAITELSQ